MSFSFLRQRSAGIQVKTDLLRFVSVLTIFLSAFLLFSVQPFFAKMVLPRLGGAASVWSVAMVFFQTVLLGGYAYAHILSSRFSVKASMAIHLCVLAAACFSLPIAVPEAWTSAPAQDEFFWLFGLFTVALGLPFFAISANAPLLQAWFASSGHKDAGNPYFLYVASNFGSLAALFGYIILVEPLFDLQAQSAIWAYGFVLLIACIIATGLLAARSAASFGPHKPGLMAGNSESALPEVAITMKERLVWIALAFIPSASLISVTSFISTDIGASPFLWVLPLSLFLMSFMIVFGPNVAWWCNRTNAILPLMFLIVAILYTKIADGMASPWFSAFLHLTTFFFVCVHCHGMLAQRKPSTKYLTQFYFALSLGGVLGGIFSGLISIRFFSWNVEYFLILFCVFLTLKEFSSISKFRLVCFILFSWLLFLYAVNDYGYIFSGFLSNNHNLYLILCLSIIFIGLHFANKNLMAIPLVCISLMCVGYFANAASSALFMERNFYGQSTVYDDPIGGTRVLMHGTTIHGAMRLKDSAIKEKPLPLTYYATNSGINATIEAARANNGGKLGKTVLIGTGAGSIACLLRSGEQLEMVEIDPLVLKIAEDTRLFRFMDACARDAKVHIGDGRLVLEKIQDSNVDLLIVDAFSSDAIPAHLLTVEAMEMYMRKIRKGGMLVLHLSNRHLDLRKVAAANAGMLGLHAVDALIIPEENAENLGMAAPTEVSVLVRDQKDFGSLLKDPRWKPSDSEKMKPWTDGYSNVLQALWYRFSEYSTP